MSAATSALTPAPFPHGAPETDEARTERHLAVLKELTEIGLTLARAVCAQATGEAAPDAPPIVSTDLGLTASRIARAVRQTVALEARLAEDRRAGQADRAAKRAQETKVRAWLRKAKVQDIVERAIEAQETGDAAEDLLSDLAERLADPDDEAVFADRPLPDLVARICRDLGVTPPTGLWDDADWGIAEPDAAFSSSVGGPPPRNAVEGEAPLPRPSQIGLGGVSPPPPCVLHGPPPPTEEERGAADLPQTNGARPDALADPDPPP
jgi:hypothetical protein